MPDQSQVQGQVPNQDQNTQNQQSLGWRAALPDEFKEHEFVKSFQKPGDFVKSALEIKTSHDALKTKLESAIIKPGKDATPEEIAAYNKALGVPDKPDDYEFPKGDDVEHDENMIKWARDVFHKAGLTKDQGALVSQAWDGFIKGIVQGQKQAIEDGKKAATEALKKEWGNDFNKNIEFTRRGWKKFSDTDFDQFVDDTKIGNHPAFIKFIYKIGQAMGEDWTPASSQNQQGKPKEGFIYDKSPAPPAQQK